MERAEKRVSYILSRPFQIAAVVHCHYFLVALVLVKRGPCAQSDWSKPMFYQSIKHEKTFFVLFFATLPLANVLVRDGEKHF